VVAVEVAEVVAAVYKPVVAVVAAAEAGVAQVAKYTVELTAEGVAVVYIPGVDSHSCKGHNGNI
jgi:hypothetical protein